MEGHPVGHIDGFGFVPDPLTRGRRAAAGAARRPPGAARGDAAPGRRGWRLRRTLRSPGCRRQRIAWDGAPVARLRPGAIGAATAGRGAGQRIPGRAAARAGAACGCSASSTPQVRDALAPLLAASAAADADARAARAAAPPGRGAGRGAGATEDDIPPALRGRLKALGRARRPVRAVRAGAAEAARGGDAGACCGRWRTACRCRRCRRRPGLDRRAAGRLAGGVRRRDGLGRRRAGAAAPGRGRAGGRRTGLARRGCGRSPVPAGLASRLRCRPEVVPAVLRGLGFRLIPAGDIGRRRSSARRPADWWRRRAAAGRCRRARRPTRLRRPDQARSPPWRRCAALMSPARRRPRTATGSGWTNGCGAPAS